MSRKQLSLRSIGKLLKRLPTNSRNASPAPPDPVTPGILVSADSGSPHASIPTDETSTPSALPNVDHERTATMPERGDREVQSGFKTLLQVIDATADVFGPLKSAIGGLNQCITIFEEASKSRIDYTELLQELDGLSAELAEHLHSSESIMMTTSIHRIILDIGAESKSAVELLARSKGQRLVDAIEDSDEKMESQRRIHGHLRRLNLNLTMNPLRSSNLLAMVCVSITQRALGSYRTKESRLARIPPTLSAMYNSAESDDLRRQSCTPGTREPQIKLLLEWLRTGGGTCWMNGMAGTGKTTIAYSVCTRLEETLGLGASFFCSRAIPELRQVKNIIPTIAYQLARCSLPFLNALCEALKLDPDAHTRAPKVQYQKLIVGPLNEARPCLPTPIIVVIDALDECEDQNSVGQILDLLLSTEIDLPIRYLISSRPEMEIYNRMMGQGITRLVLHDLDLASVKSDIEVYMRHQLRNVPLTDGEWLGLTEQCGVLFVYASAVARFIQRGHKIGALVRAVNASIHPSTVPDGHEDVDRMYATVLAAAFQNLRMGQTGRRRMRKILEAVIYNQEQMTLDKLAFLLAPRNIKQVGLLLQPLRSVLNVTEATGLVTFLHPSFRDFLTSSDRAGNFYCMGSIRHTVFAKAHLQTIEAIESKFNISGLPSSHLYDNDVKDIDMRISRTISSELVRACQSWSSHLYLGEYQDELAADVHRFLSKRLLIWMEILNLSKNMCFGRSIIQDVVMWCSENPVPDELAMLALDAYRFVSVYAAYPISQSTPHIYISLLPSWPRSSPISMAYMPRTTGMPYSIEKATMALWVPGLWIWGVSNSPIYSISLSADGTRIAAATNDSIYLLDPITGDTISHVTEQIGLGHQVSISPDGTKIVFSNAGFDLLLWDTSSRGEIVKLPTGNIWAAAPVAFSPDGTYIAFTSGRGVYIYDWEQEELILCLSEEHSKGIFSIAFSSDSLYLASGSEDGSLLIWNVKSGHIIGEPLKGHADSVLSLSFSPDGSRLASTSADGRILVWDLQSRQVVPGPLRPDSNVVFSVTFSHDGAFIATGSANKSVQIYSTQTGQRVLGLLQGHTGAVNSVVFSPDDAQIFSCSSDGTIYRWDVLGPDSPSHPPPTLMNEVRSVRYFRSGLYIASGLSDGTMYTWNVQTGETVLGPIKGHTGCITAIDLSPDDTIIASSSEDTTVRLRDVQSGKDLHGAMMHHTDVVNCVRFSPDGTSIVSGSNDFTVQIWDVKSGQPVISPLEGHSGAVLSVVFSPNGSQIASGGRDGKIHLWDTNTGRLMIDPLRSHDKSVTSVEFSSDGSRILSACQDGSIQIWEADTHRTIFDCGGRPGNWPTSAIFSRNDRIVASYSGDRAIRLWDVQSGKPISSPLIGHTGWVRSIQFSPDGSRVVSCSDDCTIRFWDVSSRIAKEDEAHVDIPTTGGSSDPWYLENDGWVTGRQKERLLWVLPELRTCFLRHPNNLIISDRRSFQMNFDGENLGERWVDCYSPK